MRERPGVQLLLSDPTQPNGALQEFGSRPRQARLIPDLLDSEAEPSSPEEPFTASTSGVVTVSPTILGRIQGSATLLLDGYEPMPIDFAAEENAVSIALELIPRPRVRITLQPQADSTGEERTDSYHIAASSTAWNAGEREPDWDSIWYEGGRLSLIHI